MEILNSVALLAITFIVIFCGMDILWRLDLRKQAAESKQQEMEEGQKKSLSTGI
jgi:hypothetical protein